MSTSPRSLQPDADPPQSIDEQLITLLEQIRRSVVDLLHTTALPTASAADLTLGMQTLKTVAETMLKVAEKWKIVENVKLDSADVEKIKAATEKIKVEKM